jgi:plasmid stabilization system protein ParE
VKRIEFAPEARAELDGAADEYEREREGRGLRFYIAVERATQAAAALPEAGPLFPAVPARLSIRRRLVPRFPFALAYRVVGDVVRIEAVAHTRRLPGYWLVRVGTE